MSPALAFAPTAIVGALCAGILFRQWRNKGFVWLAALLTLVFMTIKLLIVWIAEPFQIVPVVGLTMRGLTAPLLFPEGMLLPLAFRDAVRQGRVSGPLLVTCLVPFGSAILGAACAKLGEAARGKGRAS